MIFKKEVWFDSRKTDCLSAHECPDEFYWLYFNTQCSQNNYQSIEVMKYCTALIFRGSKFLRIAVFLNFVEIISRMRSSIRHQCGSTSKCQNIR